MRRDVLGIEGHLTESQQKIYGDEVLLRTLIRNLEFLQVFKVVLREIYGQGRRMMVLIRQSSEQKKVTLMVLSSHCLYLSKASCPFEAIEVS